MARFMKMTLCDDKDYIFSTLSLREQRAIRNKISKDDEKVMKNIIEKASEGKEMTEEETELFQKYQDKREGDMIDIARVSLAKKHNEFKITDENTKEKINDKIVDMLDLGMLSKVTSFAMTGTVPKEIEEEYDIKDLIDLTEKKE